ncbi:MAG: hypothetical protein EPN58_11515 [Rhodanobacter sp.]|nr:MAG: hypothetical protein EPN58_11515 [Rhodanobacter sp.]
MTANNQAYESLERSIPELLQDIEATTERIRLMRVRFVLALCSLAVFFTTIYMSWPAPVVLVATCWLFVSDWRFGLSLPFSRGDRS